MKPNLIVEFVRLVIEAGIGSSLAEEEKAAKVAFDNATKELLTWQLEKQKRDNFFNAIKKMGVSADTVAAKRLKSQDPDKYAYDPKILQTAEASLRGALSKARARLALFDPDAVDQDVPKYERPSTTTGVDVKMPDRGKKVYMRVDELDPITFYSWDDKRWAKAVLSIPLGFGKEEGSHPGEDRLATILGGQVQGDSVSFDIVTKNGWRWEVKGIRSAADLIRPQALGMKAYTAASKKLIALCHSINDFVQKVYETNQTVITTPEQKRLFSIIVRFVDEEIENFERGEISYGRFGTLRRALRACAKMKDLWTLDDKNDAAKRKKIIESFWNPAFDDPDAWLDEWDESIDIHRIFADVAGVFVVTPDGFYKVPRKMFKQTFKLARVSKGIPQYSVNL